MVEIVKLRASPPLNDIPGQLRQIADAIEAGSIEAKSALLVIKDEDGGLPAMYGWGEHNNDCANIGLLELAKAFIVNAAARR